MAVTHKGVFQVFRNPSEHAIPERIDILVMGCYNADFVSRLMDIIAEHRIHMVILPYLVPIQRLALAEELKKANMATEEAIRFLQDPYQFLKECGISYIYFLYGNGAAIGRSLQELSRGIHFELADRNVLELIQEMEGYRVPVVRAGYIVENDWLFYFGVYGIDIQVFSDFTRDYFSHLENIHEVSENVQEDYANQMKRLLLEYLKRFDASPATTVAMFEGPLYADPQENDSFMTEKEFGRKMSCERWARYGDDNRCMCTISCVYGKDYDNLNSGKKKGWDESRFGMLMLGNVNLNRYITDVAARFWILKGSIRAICISNCGSGEDWNHQVLKLSDGGDRIYWICNKHDMTSAGVVNDIALSAPNNRFLAIDSNWGCCFSGYIVPKEDID